LGCGPWRGIRRGTCLCFGQVVVGFPHSSRKRSAPQRACMPGDARTVRVGRRGDSRPEAADSQGLARASSTHRHHHIRRNTTLRLFAGISVIAGSEKPADCAIATTASRSRRPQVGS
jgi:hypothetical protein